MKKIHREFELETWLDEQGIEDAWELAPLLVNLKYDTGQLERLADIYSTDELAEVIPWMGRTAFCTFVP